jgi:uncharacterized protein YdhG (YjbR/CyaY superfamily)
MREAMAGSPGASDVDAYIAGFPPRTQAVLRRVRATLRKAVPGAEEALAYGVPVLKRHGTYVIYFAGFKEHWSLYPANDRLTAVVKAAAAFKVSKGTLRFPLDAPVPAKLVERVARFLAKEADARAKAKPARAKRRG